MKGVYLKPARLHVLSGAVQGWPGRSAYESAVAGGYQGSLEDFDAMLAGLPAALSRIEAYNGRVDAILEYLGDRISTLETQTAALEQRVQALEGGA